MYCLMKGRQKKKLMLQYEELRLKLSDYADKYLSAYRDKIIISPMRPDELSSTDIREMIKNGEDIRDVVTPEVKYFIDSRGADRK